MLGQSALNHRMPPALDVKRPRHINARAGPIFAPRKVSQTCRKVDFGQPGRGSANLCGMFQNGTPKAFVEPFFDLLRVVASVEDFRLQLRQFDGGEPHLVRRCLTVDKGL